MKLAGAWLDHPATQAVCAALDNAGYRALFVGGCVRNALIGLPVADIDIATDARPETVTRLAEGAGFRVIPTGVEHGTVTVLADGLAHEVTTFRRDVESFGRHAKVAFSEDVAEDAARRDFTMNALYADAGGTVIDPLGGLPDLLARRVRFVGDPHERIAEDFLRILRFFRFHAIYGDPDQGLDAEGLAACAAGADGVETLSRERIGAEMRKLLTAADPAPAVAAMAATGVLARILPGAEARGLPVLVHFEGGLAPRWQRRLVVLGGQALTEGLRLSRAEATEITAIRDAVGAMEPPAVLGYRLGAGLAADAVLARAALLETPPLPDWQAHVQQGAGQIFPIRAADLMPGLQGPALGARLKALEARWIASGFTLTRGDLLA